MENNSPIDDRPLPIPPVVWVLGGGLIAALVAFFLFNVAVNTVIYYGFIALMMSSHFFMHGAHGRHSGHQHSSTSNTAESDKNEPSGHTGGCH